MSAPTIIHGQLQVHDCVAEVYLNGIPLLRIAPVPGRFTIENTAVEQYLIPGTNSLELVMEPGSSPSGSRTEVRQLEPGARSADARIILYTGGEDTMPGEGGQILAQTSVQEGPTLTDSGLVEFPVTASAQFDHGAAHGRWDWQDAPPLVLDDATIQEARSVMDWYEAGIKKQDQTTLDLLIGFHKQDLMRAYPAMTDAYFTEQFEHLFEQASAFDEPVLARDPDAHDFRLVADGRMIQLIDRDWSASLKLMPDDGGEPLDFEIFLARINGRLAIVR